MLTESLYLRESSFYNDHVLPVPASCVFLTPCPSPEDIHALYQSWDHRELHGGLNSSPKQLAVVPRDVPFAGSMFSGEVFDNDPA